MTRLLLASAILAAGVRLFGQAGYAPPRTPWGDPDLQGIWPGDVSAPLQRPTEFGERTTLTDEEFARREAQARAQAETDALPLAAPRSGRGGGIGPPDHWLERGPAAPTDIADRGSAERQASGNHRGSRAAPEGGTRRTGVPRRVAR